MKTNILAACLIVFVLCSFASAEMKPTKHQGLYLGFGFGPGSSGFNEDNSNYDFGRDSGLVLNMRIGSAFNDNLLIGLEIDAWRKEENNVALQYNNYAAAVIYYPSTGFFLKGGFAYSVLVAEAYGLSSSESGSGFMAGVGYEIRTGDKFALVPSFQYIGQDYDGYSTNFYSIVLGFNWFWYK